jgi:hypothetical protein
MKQLLANELRDVGFQVEEFRNGLLVSLKNRKVSMMEVDEAIWQAMEIRVGMSSVSQGVFIGTVTWLN